MSRITRCNRCGAEAESKIQDPGGTDPVNRLRSVLFRMGSDLQGWRSISMTSWPVSENIRPERETFDMCRDCVEVFLLQFMTGAEIAAITQSAETTKLPHDPMVDCVLAFDPKRGGFICQHDNPALFDQLVGEAGEGEPPAGPPTIPDYAQARRTARLLSQHGEDLTEAYSPQEPVEPEPHVGPNCAPMWHDSEDRDKGTEPDYCACEGK